LDLFALFFQSLAPAVFDLLLVVASSSLPITFFSFVGRFISPRGSVPHGPAFFFCDGPSSQFSRNLSAFFPPQGLPFMNLPPPEVSFPRVFSPPPAPGASVAPFLIAFLLPSLFSEPFSREGGFGQVSRLFFFPPRLFSSCHWEGPPSWTTPAKVS